MRVYVAGAGGMLGDGIRRVLKHRNALKCTDITLSARWLEYCDFRDQPSYHKSVEDFKPDLLFHIGAHTSLEYCETNPDDAYLTNTISVEHACSIANQLRIPLVYISTAGIFDGRKDAYDDLDTPHPLGVYARSKYLGEVEVGNRVERHFIFRAGWMMGGGPGKDHKFVGTILRQINRGDRLLRVVNDRFGSPTYTIDFARNMRSVIASGRSGLFNMVCSGSASRLEVAREILRLCKLQDFVAIEEVPSSFFSKEYFAPRPASERLINYRLDLLGLNLMRDWRVAIAEYLQEWPLAIPKQV